MNGVQYVDFDPDNFIEWEDSAEFEAKAIEWTKPYSDELIAACVAEVTELAKEEEEMAKKAERRRQRRAAKLSDKVSLTQREKLLNFEQSLITRQLNDKIKANPNIILKN